LTLPAVLEELSPLGHPGNLQKFVRLLYRARFSFQGTEKSTASCGTFCGLDLDLGSQTTFLSFWQSIGIEGPIIPSCG